MNELTENCLDNFPEMLDLFQLEDLKEASEIRAYIFFEDYFNAFLEENKIYGPLLARAASYIEKLAHSEDRDLQNLTEIGILEGLINRDVSGIAKYLGPHSKELLEQATVRTRIDRETWHLRRPKKSK